MGVSMVEETKPCPVKALCSFMRLCGTLARSVTDGFYFFVPFMKPDESWDMASAQVTTRVQEKPRLSHEPERSAPKVERKPEPMPAPVMIQPVVVEHKVET
ncbi:MAG: hypothetical protein HQL11_06440, partial [Candidatus Omnitrophica bacterium]|nr:hypothetical protein [Candidatus Omnitrophota bacterium]